MPCAKLNELEIEYEVHGSPDADPLLMVHGLGVQLTNWSESFIEALVGKGFFVIVYDNRDVGLSSKFDSWGAADIPEAFRQARARETVTAPYTLEDMADDGIALLGSLGISKAHILGLSNGGAIAQLMAIRHPEQVASLVSMMATSGRRGLPRPTEAAQAWLNKPNNPLGTREGAMDEAIETAALIGSPGATEKEEAIIARAAQEFDRCFYPDGSSRHLLASLASGDSRVAQLPGIVCPTLVIHGNLDPLVPVAQGKDVYDSIQDAEMLVIENMAHDVPDHAVAQITEAIRANADRAA
jgi:proline iminopeptidase